MINPRFLLTFILIASLLIPPAVSSRAEYPQFLPEKIVQLKLTVRSPLKRGEDPKKRLTPLLQWLAHIEKDNVWEKQAALDTLLVLQYQKYRTDRTVFDPILAGLHDSNPTIRVLSASYFKRLAHYSKGCCKETEIVPSLIGSLEDENPEVRKEVCKALGFYKDRRAVQPLIKQLRDNNPWVKLEAVYALGEVKDSQAVSPLLSLLNEHSGFSNMFLQQECVIALRKINNKSPAVIEGLIGKFNEEYLKAEIIKTLGTFRTSKSRDLLLESLEHNDEIIRILSLKALSRLPITRFRGANKVPDREINHFINSLKDPAPNVRAASAEVLGDLRNEQAIEPLIEALRDSDQNVKREAIKSLHYYPNHRAFHSIAEVIGCDENSLKAFAAEQFKNMGQQSWTRRITLRFPHGGRYNLLENTDAVTAILDTIDKADLKGKIELVKLLGLFHDDRISPVLDKILNTPADSEANGQPDDSYLHRELKKSATSSLGKMPNRDIVPDLLSQLKDKDQRTREQTASALGKFMDSRAFEPLMNALDDENRNVRKAALHSLGSYDDPRVTDINIVMLKDEYYRVRYTAALYFKNTPDKRAVEPLIDLLGDPTLVAPLAADALGVIGDKKAVPALIDAVQNKFNRKRSLHLDTDLRGKAAGALGLIKAKTAIPVLIEILTNQDEEYVLRHYYIPFALGEIGDPSAIEHLESLLKEEGMPKHKIKKAIAKLKKIQQNGEKEE